MAIKARATVKKYEARFSSGVVMSFIADDEEDAKRVVDYWIGDSKQKSKEAYLFLFGLPDPVAKREKSGWVAL